MKGRSGPSRCLPVPPAPAGRRCRSPSAAPRCPIHETGRGGASGAALPVRPGSGTNPRGARRARRPSGGRPMRAGCGAATGRSRYEPVQTDTNRYGGLRGPPGNKRPPHPSASQVPPRGHHRFRPRSQSGFTRETPPLPAPQPMRLPIGTALSAHSANRISSQRQRHFWPGSQSDLTPSGPTLLRPQQSIKTHLF